MNIYPINCVLNCEEKLKQIPIENMIQLWEKSTDLARIFQHFVEKHMLHSLYTASFVESIKQEKKCIKMPLPRFNLI